METESIEKSIEKTEQEYEVTRKQENEEHQKMVESTMKVNDGLRKKLENILLRSN